MNVLFNGIIQKVAQSISPTNVATAAYDRFVLWRAKRQYGTYAGTAFHYVNGLTLAQLMMIGSFAVKAYKAMKGNQSTLTVQPGVQSTFEYKVGPTAPSPWPQRLLALIVLMISARYRQAAGHRPIRMFTLFGRDYHVPVVPLVGAAGAVAIYKFVTALFNTIVLNNKSPIGATLATRFISKTLVSGKLSSSQQREVFREAPLVRTKAIENHSHGNSAADRNCGVTTSSTIALTLGLEPYLIQQSLSDDRKGRDGDRSFYWAKDLAVPPKEFHFDPSTQAAVLVDVDHYIDMPHLLAYYPGTYFVCTLLPTAAAKSEGEYTFRFLEDGKVHYRVSGGGEFTHHIWDYSGDTFLVETAGLIEKRVVAYHIDKKYVDDHHAIIMLTVIGAFDSYAFVPTSWVLEGKTLSRFKPVFGEHVVLDVVTKECIKRSVAVVGQHNAVTLPKSQFDAVEAVARVAKVPITPGMVASNIAVSSAVGLPTERLPPGHAAIIAGFVRAGMPHFPPIVYPPEMAFKPIWFAKHDYDAPVPLAPFGSPLIHECYGFSDSIAADDRCISGRIEKFQSNTPVELPPRYAGYMKEFIEFLIPDSVKHTGVPADHDEVREKQPSPSQRAILAEADVTGDNYEESFDTFKKKETYPKVTDPRNITTMKPKVKQRYSCYIYAFDAGVMRYQPWYAFNKTPKEVAERVGEMLRFANHAVAGDGNRFDGHVNLHGRTLERMAMMRYFHPGYHSDLNESMDEQIAEPGRTEHGRKYNSGHSRGSGSGETADFNSIDTACSDYCALRQTTVNGRNLTPEEAWAKLGLYGGDDSLTPDVDPDFVVKAAAVFGQDYEVEVYARGEPGVNFLNRFFGPDVWEGDINSMCNPARALAKLWVGPARYKPFSDEALERFAERASGYYRMDRNSPVLGEIVRNAHALLGERVDGELMPWDGKHSIEANWPNEDSGWMNDMFLKFIPDFDFDRFRGWVSETILTHNSKMLLAPPLCVPVKQGPLEVKQDCVVGDDIFQLPPKEKWEADDSSEPRDPTGLELLQMRMAEPAYTNPFDDFVVGDNSDSALGVSQSPDYIADAMREVAKAAKLVPKVNDKGKRIQEVKKVVCSHKPYFKKDGTRAPCVCEWNEPKRRPNEDQVAYNLRLANWKTNRYAVAKKRGVALQ